MTGTRKAVNDLWNTLQKMEVNSKNIWLYQLAEHYGIDYEAILRKELGDEKKVKEMLKFYGIQ